MDQVSPEVIVAVHKEEHSRARLSLALYVGGVITLLVFLAFLGQMSYWWWWESSDVMTISKFDVATAPGERFTTGLAVHMDYCKSEKYANLQADVSYALVDSTMYSLPGKMSEPLAAGCHSYTDVVYIPSALPDGTYELAMQREYTINPLRKVIITSRSNNFVVRTHEREAAAINAFQDLLEADRGMIKAVKDLVKANNALIKERHSARAAKPQ